MSIDHTPHKVGPAARALGFAGLLPQVAAVSLQLWAGVASGWQRNLVATAASVSALIYGALILSFLGGIWWGFAMRRDEGQARLAGLAVAPSLAAAGLIAATTLWGLGWSLVSLGSVILLTLPVDRHLAGSGEAPMGWMHLRIPLSVGLGVLTILAGILAPR